MDDNGMYVRRISLVVHDDKLVLYPDLNALAEFGDVIILAWVTRIQTFSKHCKLHFEANKLAL